MFKKFLVVGFFLSTLAYAQASSPVLSVSTTGSGDVVSLQVTGDANTPLTMYYKSLSSGTTQGTTIGTTDDTGTFSSTFSTASLGVDSSVPVYILANGYISNSITWPYASTVTSSVFTLSQTVLSLYVGQSTTLTATGTGSYYVSNSTNGNVASVTVSGSILNIAALSAGTSVVTVCQSSTECANVTITVGTTPVAASSVVLSPVLSVGQSSSFTLSGDVAPYYLTNVNTGVFSGLISGTNLTFTALAAGYATTSVCSATGSCTPILLYVNQPIQTTAMVAASSKYVFNNPLKFGSVGQEVIELQKRLQLEGYFSAVFSPNYGAITMAAVKAYQKDHGLDQLGNVGPATRAALNN